MHSVSSIFASIRYLWLIFPLTLAYLTSRPENWWDSFKARRAAQVVGTICGVPGFLMVSLCAAGLALAFHQYAAVTYAVVLALFGLIPGAIFLMVGGLIFKMKKAALPLVAVLVGLSVVRALYVLLRPSGWMHFTPAMLGTLAIAFAGQILLIVYLRRMRQWGYFK